MIGEQQHKISFAEFELDAARRVLRRDGEPLALYAKTFDLLSFLVENNGRTVTKDEILEKVWAGQFVEEANLSVQISALRKALGEKKNAPRFLVTIPGKGYKFVAEIETDGERSSVEKDEIEPPQIGRKTESEFRGAALVETKNDFSAPLLPVRKRHENTRRQRVLKFSAAALLLCAIAAAAIYYYFRSAAPPPFQKINLARLTNNGRVAAATLAPDGKYFAYVLSETEGSSLWIQQVGTASNLRLLPPLKADFWHLTFSPDGAFIYYNLFFGDRTDNELYRIPSLGGVIEKIPGVITYAVSFAPDGKHFAYIQPNSERGEQNYLIISDANGANQKIVAAKPHPNTFIFDGDYVAWSPDGEKIATAVNHLKTEENYSSLAVIDVKDGTETSVASAPLRHIYDLEWLSDGSGLLVCGSENASAPNRLWLVPFPAGEARPLTNDLNSYDWIKMSAGGKSLIARQTQTTNSIYVGEAGGSFREIANEVGALNSLVWTPDGKIVFRSSADGVSNLWRMNADGSQRVQLTVNAEVGQRGMCATADGKYFVFASWRSGKSNLWRVDADGKNLTQITDGEVDAYPACTPDGQTVVYQRGILTQPTLWKVSVNGGEPLRLTDFRAKWASVSPDGKRISYFRMDDDKWRFGFLAPDGKREAHAVDVPPNLKESFVSWSRDGKSLFYIGAVGNTGNVWSLPIDGGSPQPVTNFTSHLLANFSLSPDGRQIAAARSLSVSDVVLITDETPAR